MEKVMNMRALLLHEAKLNDRFARGLSGNLFYPGWLEVNGVMEEYGWECGVYTADECVWYSLLIREAIS